MSYGPVNGNLSSDFTARNEISINEQRNGAEGVTPETNVIAPCPNEAHFIFHRATLPFETSSLCMNFTINER